MQAILNFRDLSEAAPGLARGRIYRSARPCFATPGDVAALRDDLGVKVLMDLRTPGEVGAAIGAGGPFYDAISAGVFEHRLMPLMTKNTYRNAILKRMGKRLQLRVGAAALKAKAGGSGDEQLRDAVMPLMRDFLNASGLVGLNEILLEIAGPTLVEAMGLLAQSDQRPVLIFCTAGKDRTGLLSALTLLAAGVTEQAAIADYARSHELREAFNAEAYAGAVERLGLDADAFLGAPPENMVATLAYLEATYGGVTAYLGRGGFDASALARLRAVLTA